MTTRMKTRTITFYIINTIHFLGNSRKLIHRRIAGHGGRTRRVFLDDEVDSIYDDQSDCASQDEDEEDDSSDIDDHDEL